MTVPHGQRLLEAEILAALRSAKKAADARSYLKELLLMQAKRQGAVAAELADYYSQNPFPSVATNIAQTLVAYGDTSQVPFLLQQIRALCGKELTMHEDYALRKLILGVGELGTIGDADELLLLGSRLPKDYERYIAYATISLVVKGNDANPDPAWPTTGFQQRMRNFKSEYGNGVAGISMAMKEVLLNSPFRLERHTTTDLCQQTFDGSTSENRKTWLQERESNRRDQQRLQNKSDCYCASCGQRISNASILVFNQKDQCPRCLFLTFRSVVRSKWSDLLSNKEKVRRAPQMPKSRIHPYQEIPFSVVPLKCIECGNASFPVDPESKCPRCSSYVVRAMNEKEYLQEIQDSGSRRNSFHNICGGLKTSIDTFPSVEENHFPLPGRACYDLWLGEYVLENEHGERWISERKCVWIVARILGKAPQRQWTAPWLRSPDTGALLFVDAFFPDENLAVEYQGEQHYKNVGFFGGEEAFERRQQLDAAKMRLLMARGVRLLCVAHDDLYEESIRIRLGDLLH